MGWMVDRRLRKVQQRLQRARARLASAEAELQVLGEQGDEDRLRAIVSENPAEAAESRDSVRHTEAARRQVDSLRDEIVALERELDTLLDRRSGTNG